jgi:N-glycosylase/DNA lyase
MNTKTKNKVVRLSLTDRQTLLINKEQKSTFDYCKLANVTDKIENKTASKVYKNCIASPEIKKILGTNKIPTFAEFLTKLPVKDSYSNWIGFLTFAKFNVKAELKKKVERQNKTEAKK